MSALAPSSKQADNAAPPGAARSAALGQTSGDVVHKNRYAKDSDPKMLVQTITNSTMAQP
ncbi:hypothetical protein D3C87_2171750 [compost metagenome]